MPIILKIDNGFNKIDSVAKALNCRFKNGTYPAIIWFHL